MLSSFIDFVESVLPSIDPSAKNQAKKAIDQFNKDGHEVKYLMSSPLDKISQGDIISELQFNYYSEDGSLIVYKAPGMIMSTSCDIDQKDTLNIVPLLPIESISQNATFMSEVKKNHIYHLFYLPNYSLKDYIIDFSKTNSYNKDLIFAGIEKDRIHRLYSLSQVGLYFFIIKLTVFYMRKEDSTTLNNRLVQ